MLGRHILFLLAYLTTSINLLEQAIWSASTPEEDATGDLAVFVGWIAKGELEETVRKIKVVLNQTSAGAGLAEWELVYGPNPRRKSKL